MARLKLDINSNSRNIPEDLYEQIEDLSVNGIEIEAKDYESFPMPWDAVCYIENGKFILEGGIAPGGVGNSVTKIPLNQVSRFIDLYVSTDVGEDEQSDIDKLDAIFDEYGWL